MADYFVSLWCLRICCCISNRSIFSCRWSSLQGASFYVSVCVLQIKKLLVGPDRNPVPWSTLYLLLHKYSYTYIQHIRFLKMWLLWEYDGNLISDLIKCSYCIGTCTIGVQHAACLKSFRDEFKVNMLLLFPVDLTIDGRFKKCFWFNKWPDIYAQEEDSKSFMDKDRRREAIKLKLQRLDENITKTKKDCEGKLCYATFKIRSKIICCFSVILILTMCRRNWKTYENILWKSIFFQPKEPWGNRAAAWWGK